ncbi:MAG: hypothetical protein ABIB47_04095 [Candidatus Woesearchaeota archaeon]
MKTRVLVLILLLFAIPALADEVDVDLAYGWLVERPNTDVFTAALSALAVNNADSSKIGPYLDFIGSEIHANGDCWPSGGCDIQDTALALITESRIGLNLGDGRSSQEIRDAVRDWFIQQQSLASLSGTWILQIVTTDSGTCDLRYTKRGEAESEVRLNVDAGRITYGRCEDQTFFILGGPSNNCLGTNLASKPSTLVDVSCVTSLPNAEISLIYLEGNTFYLISEPQIGRAVMRINNGFFGNKLNTLYADWALKSINSKVNSLIYLRKNAENTVVDNALLYLSTLDNAYINNLITLQSNFGGFDDANDFENGLAGLALKTSGQTARLELLKSSLGTKQRPDGSWMGDAKTTAMILYGVFEGGNVPEPLPAPSCDEQDGFLCDADEYCPGDELESSDVGICCDVECSETPLECTLMNPRWLNRLGAEITQAVGNAEGYKRGDRVILSVGGGGCGGDSIAFDVFESEPGQDRAVGVLGPIIFSEQEAQASVEWDPVWFDDNPLPLVEDNPEYYFIARVVNGDEETDDSAELNVLKPPEIGTRKCNDDVDNDGDGLIDWPDDTGCYNSTDNTEDNNCVSSWNCTHWTPACEGGADAQTRNCWDSHECGPPCSGDGCATQRSCSSCVPVWQCGDWSTCYDELQVRTCTDREGCGYACGEFELDCLEERDCFVEADEDEYEDDDTGDDTGEDTSDGTGDGDEEEESLICYVNGYCETDYGEDNDNCPEDCPLAGLGDEDDSLPPLDDGDGYIDEGDGFDEAEEPGGGSFWIIIIILLLLLVLGGIYFFLVKKPKGKAKKPGFNLPEAPKRPALFGSNQPPVRQIRAPVRPKESKLDTELEKSLREAKRLLGK